MTPRIAFLVSTPLSICTSTLESRSHRFQRRTFSPLRRFRPHLNAPAERPVSDDYYLRIAPTAREKRDESARAQLFRAAMSASMLPVTVVIASVLALVYPPSFYWFKPSWAAPCLMGIMLCMGLTLRARDVTAVASQPRRLLLGAAAQYLIMPSVSALVARLFALPVPLATGLVLVGCCPGGAASNIVCLFAGADVAYSVLLTLTSTALSVAATPTLVLALAGQWMPINAMALFTSVVQVVVGPLVLGALARAAAPNTVAAVQPILPSISVLLVGAIVGSVMSNSAGLSAIRDPRLVCAIAALHLVGAVLGYTVGWLARVGPKKSRTLSIEVCMQNSTLASSLATAHFSNPLVAVPGAISATMHSILGSILAGIWRVSDLAKLSKRASSKRC